MTLKQLDQRVKDLETKLTREAHLRILNARVGLALIANPPAWLTPGRSRAEITCELCNDEPWWPANGFSESDRQDWCGPDNLNCPGFGGTP
jgi:hypothetical protein